MNVFAIKNNVKTPLPINEKNCIMCGKYEKECPADAVFIYETFYLENYHVINFKKLIGSNDVVKSH